MGWTNVPASYSPAKEMRLRVLDFGVDKYGLNAYLFDSTNDAAVNYDRVLFAPAKDGTAAVGTLAEGKWADVKVKIAGGSLDGKTAGMLVKVERLAGDLSQVRLFHTSVSRAIATWAGWPGEPGLPDGTDFAEYLAQRFPTSTAADFAILEAGITSEETYVEQGQYWSTGHLPMLEYVVKTYKPDLLLAGYPTTDEFQHQFLGLVTRTLPGGRRQPRLRRRQPRRRQGQPRCPARGVHPGRLRRRRSGADDGPRPDGQGPDDVRRLRSRLRAAVPGHRRQQGPGGPRAPVQAADIQLPSGVRRDHRQGQGLLGRRHGPDLPQPRRPRSGGWRPDPGRRQTRRPLPSPRSRPRSRASPIPTTGPATAAAEGWKVIDRVFTKAEARYIPNGPGSTADMAHPTRTGDVVVFSYPPYQFDAATPGTLVAPSAFFGQHGYVPDVTDLAANVNMRATFLAGGKGIAKGSVTARTIDLAPTLAFILGIPEPQMSQGRVLLDVVKGRPATSRSPSSA